MRECVCPRVRVLACVRACVSPRLAYIQVSPHALTGRGHQVGFRLGFSPMFLPGPLSPDAVAEGAVPPPPSGLTTGEADRPTSAQHRRWKHFALTACVRPRSRYFVRCAALHYLFVLLWI